jgi:3-hydroxybutyryl-CoA dehydratase
MQGKFLEDLTVGDSAELVYTVDSQTVEGFARISGDNNPVHLDEAFAATTPFKTRIAHGMLSAGYISAVIGTVLPGPGSIYVGQSLKFKRPVKIDDVLTARVTIKSIDLEKARIVLDTVCLVADKAVLEGEAEIMVPRRPG